MRIPRLFALAVAGALLLSGCASLPRDRGSAGIDALLKARGTPAPAWPRDEAPAAEKPTGRILTLRQSVELAFTRSPVIRQQYAELGLASADHFDATKLPSLGLEYSRMAFRDDHTKLTRGLSLALADVLLMPSRARIARENLAGTRERVAAAIGDLEADVETAWFEYSAALQTADVQARAARVARVSAEYARSLHAAGNLPARALAQELAAASGADIASARAQAKAVEARANFATLVGLSVREDWRVAAQLPALPHHDDTPAGLLEASLESRLDIAAARREADSLERGWRLSRNWRWLGEFEAGYEWERDHRESLRGPSFRLNLPLFHWNRGGVLRARSAMEAARVNLEALELGAANDISARLDHLASARRIAEIYRDTLLPQREAVSARIQEEVNFMLVGAFEALAARREQFDAYHEYVDAVRDYWLARVELRRASGGALAPADSTESLQLESAPAAGSHSHHGAHR